MSSSAHRRIGILSWDFGEGRGGLGLAMRWAAEAFEVTEVATPNRGFQPFTGIFGKHILFSVLLPFTLQRWIDRHRIELLLVPVCPGGIFLIRKPLRCRVCALAYHTYAQQSRVVPGERWKSVFQPLERRTLRLVDSVVSFCSDTKDFLKSCYDVPSELLPQMFDIDAWVPSENGTRKEPGLCVCVSRLDSRKGLDVVLQAWRRICREHSHAKLVVVGKGPHLKLLSMERKYAGSTLEHRHDLPREELIRLVQNAEVFISASYLEGFGLSVAEAMAAGTSVVATACDGIRCLINSGDNGVLVSTGDSLQLAEEVSKLLRDAPTRDRIARKASLDVQKRFSVESSRLVFRSAVSAL